MNKQKAKCSGLEKQLSPLLAWDWSVVGVVGESSGCSCYTQEGCGVTPAALGSTSTPWLGRLGWDRQPDRSDVPTLLCSKGDGSCCQSRDNCRG